MQGHRHDARLAVALALGFGVIGYLLTDTINWSRGFGYDGLAYGTLAMHFPSAIAGTGVVIPGGIGNPLAAGPHGLDSYNALRWLPSGLAWLLMAGSAHTVSDTLRAFSALNVLCLAVIAWSWFRTAERIGLSRWVAWLGLIALLVNFAVRTALYQPVATDLVGLALGSLSLCLWATGNRSALWLVTLAAAFTWPSQVAMGAIMLIWPYRRSEEGRGSSRVGLGAGVATLLLILIDHRLGGVGVGPWKVDNEGVLLIGGVACALFVWAVLTPLMREWRWVGPDWRRLPSVALLVLAALVVQQVVAVRAGQSDVRLFGNALIDSTRLPGLFLVASITYFGPLFLIGVLMWPKVARAAARHGMVPALALAALFLLFGQSRTDVSFYPVIVLAVCLALRDVTGSQVALFGVVSFVTARFWMPIGRLPADISPAAFSSAPMQRWDMSLGAYTSPAMYWWQLAAVVLIGAIYARRRSQPHISTKAGPNPLALIPPPQWAEIVPDEEEASARS